MLTTPALNAPTGLLLALLSVAVATDLRTRRIPNLLVLAGLVCALLVSLFAPPVSGASSTARVAVTLIGATLAALLILPLYLLRACGAGDVKLMAMAGAFLDPATAASAVIWTYIAGGVLSLVYLMGRGVASQTLHNLRLMATSGWGRVRAGRDVHIEPLARTAARLPYGVAIAAGTLAALTLRLPTIA